jgi:hypothetical protein
MRSKGIDVIVDASSIEHPPNGSNISAFRLIELFASCSYVTESLKSRASLLTFRAFF